MVNPPVCHNIYTKFFCLTLGKCITKEGGGELNLLRLYIVKLLMHVHIIAITSGLQSDTEQDDIGGPGTPNDHEQMATESSVQEHCDQCELMSYILLL